MDIEKMYFSWESTDSDDPIFLEKSEITQAGGINLNLLIVKRKNSLDNFSANFLASLGVVTSAPDNSWLKMAVAVFMVLVHSPIEIKVFKETGIDDVLKLIHLDKKRKNYLREDELKIIYKKRPELEKVVDVFIRKEFIEEPDGDGKMFFNGKILKNISSIF